MEIDTIINSLEKLEMASLYRTPKKPRELVDPWFEQFQHMPESQFLSAINEIIKLETVWPAIAVVYRYASNWQDDESKAKCPYCEDNGFVLIKTKNMNEAYACKCPVGKLRQANLRIASYESLGIPWPEIDDNPARRSDKMTADNRRQINVFLERISRKT
jgi:hypothetical protein